MKILLFNLGPIEHRIIGWDIEGFKSLLSQEIILWGPIPDDKFIYEVSEGLGPDKSALFFLGRANDRDAIVEQLKLSNGRLLSTSLPPEVRKDLEKALEGR